MTVRKIRYILLINMRGSIINITLSICLAATLSACADQGKSASSRGSTDASISAEIRALFAQDAAISSSNQISVQTRDHVVFLRGLLPTPYLIAEAGSLAESASGVVAVRNLISLDGAR